MTEWVDRHGEGSREEPSPHVRIVIESDAADVPETVLRSIVADAVLAIHGRINVTRVGLVIDGIEMEVSP